MEKQPAPGQTAAQAVASLLPISEQCAEVDRIGHCDIAGVVRMEVIARIELRLDVLGIIGIADDRVVTSDFGR
jgi:hypothetical protein